MNLTTCPYARVRDQGILQRPYRLPMILAILSLSIVSRPAIPAGTDSTTPAYTFAVIGDQGCGCPAQAKVAAQMIRRHHRQPFHDVFTVGDNIYGRGPSNIMDFLAGHRLLGGDPRLFKERFDLVYRPLIRKGVRFHAALGNHDLLADRGRSMILDQDRFGIHSSTGYYTFRPTNTGAGPPLVEAFILNSNRFRNRKDRSQIRWLERALTQSPATWKIVLLHHPLLTPPGNHHAWNHVRKYLEPIFIQGGVRVVLAGHNHFYARMIPDHGIVHFVTGNGGERLRRPRPSPLTACALMRHGFLVFRATADTLAFEEVSDQGRTVDQGVLRRTGSSSSGHESLHRSCYISRSMSH